MTFDPRPRPGFQPSIAPPGGPRVIPLRRPPAGASTTPVPPASAASTATRRSPWVELRSFSFHPSIYPPMIQTASPDAKPGDLVTVYDRQGREFGAGLWNPKSRVPLRVLHHGDQPFAEEQLLRQLDAALDLRLVTLGLPKDTDAFRVVHSDGDALSGLVIDKYADTLSISVHSLGMAQRLPRWLPHLHQRLGTRQARVEIDERALRHEGISPRTLPSDPIRPVKIREHGVRYEVDFAEGHKTGFFCDQRDNRRRLATFARGARVLDLCCYTGGFSLAAKVLGGAEDVTGVDLDETAVEQARRNANLNQARVTWVHCDAFTWARQMQKNTERWDIVVLDPPKLVFDREDIDGGRKKYEDLNILAMSLVKPGGLFVSCSCSGMLGTEEFEEIVIRATHRLRCQIQILDRTGAALDHPVLSNCPESRYLKVVWGRVLA